MRAAIDARLKYYRPGGIAEYTRHLVRALAGLDTETHYTIVHHVRDAETLAPGPNFHRVSTLTPSHHRLERWLLAAELLPRRFDLYHTPEGILPQRAARREIITVHDVHYLHFPQYMTAASRRYYNDQIERSTRRAARILVSSEATRADLVTLLGVPTEKIVTHQLGVDDHFRPANEDTIAAMRARYHLPPGYLLFVGTFEPRKNLPGLFAAYARLRADLPDAPPLVLVGRRGWLMDEIEAAVKQHALEPHLRWITNAPRADLPALYSGARLLALPSHYEGFGLTALEAMACGTPPIVSNRSSLPEVTGDAGLLIDPDDPDALADALHRLLTDDALRDDLRTRGLKRAAEFTWQRTAATVLDTYRRVAAL